MTFRFWAVAGAFHVVLGSVSLLLWRRWRGSLSGSGLRLTGRTASAIALLGSAAFILAVTGAIVVRDPLFVPPRLLSQALFGEGPILTAFAAVSLWRAGHRLVGAFSALVCVALLAVYVDAYHVEPHDLRRREHVVSTPGAGQRVLRLVHLSDIQTAVVGDHERRAIREAVALRPDLVVITGDFVHQRRRPGTYSRIAADLARLFREERLSARLGVFGVEGNTDLGRMRELRQLGVRWLHDETIRLGLPDGGTLALTGLSFRSSLGHASLTPLLSRESTDAVRIVAGHVPDFVRAEGVAGEVDLALAGHTHGGQVVLPLFGPPLTFSRLPRGLAWGLHPYGGTMLHVSRGVGMERGNAPQLRFLCPPEICLLTVRY